MRLLSSALVLVGLVMGAAGLYLLISPLPFGTTDITGSLPQQTEFIARAQITNAGGFAFVGGLLLVLIGVQLRDGGKS